MTDLVGHLLLFVVLGAVFLMFPLLLGLLLRPSNPTAQKKTAYECGEPTIGTSYVQFDLRFYVVALLFIIFDVEVAFFFPWATVYGGATSLLDERISPEARAHASEKLLNFPPGTLPAGALIQPEAAQTLALTGLVDILVFFGVLLVAFAYVWKRGDLDWVRAMVDSSKRAMPARAGPPAQPADRRPVESVA